MRRVSTIFFTYLCALSAAFAILLPYVMSNYFLDELARRRTFAVIAHPDAGKTTLTEKLLLFGGAIQVAGAVKSNKIKRSTTSDFMEIERQRGISVATSVMTFDYRNLKINILDTPGHQDFAEDTYRTLSAVDSVIVVVDAAKGVEAQTEKLVAVCKMRATPIIVFVNKLDREGMDVFDLLDDIEEKLKIKVRPLSYPIGMGSRFKGVYSMYEQKLILFRPHSKQQDDDKVEITDLASPDLDLHVGTEAADSLREDVEMIEGVYPPFDRNEYLAGRISPVFFGSAVNNFGVRELLDCFTDIAPHPLSRHTEEREVQPDEPKFTGFVFKIHANMDPKHRDRIAFVRVTSGQFKRNTNYLHVRQGKEMKFSSPTAFMGDTKSIVEEAFAGDIVGIHDTGNFKIGDSLSEGEKLKFKGIPAFSPEQFRYVENADPMKTKQLAKGLDQLMDEGVAQLFTLQLNGRRIVGTVGALQFEVIQYRLLHEYGASCSYEPIQLHKACWVRGDAKQLEEFRRRYLRLMANDKDGREVYLAESAWSLATARENYPLIEFYFTSEF